MSLIFQKWQNFSFFNIYLSKISSNFHGSVIRDTKLIRSPFLSAFPNFQAIAVKIAKKIRPGKTTADNFLKGTINES
ncbi:hypothetical protein NON20_13575 [Synechocystis sp. B12]|nr:hypothetical protein NON20_13575 [Synechocystis sp. B12]